MLVEIEQQDAEANLIELCYIMNDALSLCANVAIEDKRAMSEIVFSIKNILVDVNVLLGRSQRKSNITNLATIDKLAS